MKTKFLQTIDYVLLLCVMVLTAIGIAFIYSAALNKDLILTNTKYINQIIWAFIGLVLLGIVANYDYRKIERYVFYLYIAICCVLLYTCLFGSKVNSSRSWIGIGRLGIQPSELCKIIFILFLGWYFNTSENENPAKRFVVALGILVIPVLLILKQPDLGTALVFLSIFLFMSYIAGVPIRWILFLLFTGLLSIGFTILVLWEEEIVQHPVPVLRFLTDEFLKKIIIFSILAIAIISGIGYYLYREYKFLYWICYVSIILLLSIIFCSVILKVFEKYSKQLQYMRARLYIWIKPEVSPKKFGWNTIQSKIAIGAGGFQGRGFTHGTQSHLNYLPEQGTDFIFSILCEEWGFLGGMLVFILYTAILLRIVYVIRKTPNKFGAYICTGIFGMFFFHFIENIGMVMGMCPITGIPLLFVSYGGSSLISSMISIGLVMSVKYRRFNFMD